MNFNNLKFLLFPRKCACCGTPVGPEEHICDTCGASVVRNEAPHCPYCGVSEKDCACKKNGRPYDRIVAPFYYEGPVRDAILRLKFGKQEGSAPFLAEALADEIEARYFGEHFTCIAVVPMSRDRYAERGFNQARTLAELVMKHPPTPLRNARADYGLLRKASTENMQHMLGAEGRRQNIRDSVSVAPGRDLAGERILLVDDIVTTGATAGECAAILRMSGAESVCVASAAVTRYKNGESPVK